MSAISSSSFFYCSILKDLKEWEEYCKGRSFDIQQIDRKELFSRVSENDCEAIGILKQQYLTTGENLLELLEYLNQVASNGKTGISLSVDEFLKGLHGTELLEKGLQVALKKNSKIVFIIFEAMDERNWKYFDVVNILQLANEVYEECLFKEDKRDIKEYLSTLVGRLIDWCQEKGQSIPRLEYFCLPSLSHLPRERRRLEALPVDGSDSDS